ncbi:hypothetical protein DNTS_014945 [Danionella cerebrum]|uniref:Uncharacterized protein n=1 Tax=Danionella cerebrum TaxID=2873325 RepID=A0A553RNS9_9TELE|nr:hypothetical protein DNTS_014945 [Danionella translucida]
MIPHPVKPLIRNLFACPKSRNAATGGVSTGGAGGCSGSRRIRVGPSHRRYAAARPAHTRAPAAFCPSLGAGVEYSHGLGNQTKQLNQN